MSDIFQKIPQSPLQVLQAYWQPIETAPKDGTPILGWCNHDADPYHLGDGSLTIYGAHVEGLSHCDDGPNVLVFGGEVDDRNWECPQENCYIPSWWFLYGSEFETAANPTHWMPLPPPPEKSK